VKKVVQDLTSGGIDWQREKWQSGLGSKFIHQGEKNAAKYADEVIVLSKGVQDYFKETYGRETHFIPNGVNRPQIREASLITDKFGLKKDSYILFLGRLVPEKGIRYLVEAFKNVKTDKKLVIAGGSSDTDSFMEELKELAKGDDRILFTGFVQGAMLDELYSNAYIYTLPSDLEGISAVLKFYLKGIVQSIIKGDRIKDCVDPNDPKQRKENFLRFNEQIVNRTKEAYGRYRNVFLEDYSELEMEIAELDTLIEDLSAYMQSTGRKYADHAATLRSWSARKKRQQKPGAGIPDYTYNKEESL
jgi:glycosyltransferase involved in cell wall biosynthesis